MEKKATLINDWNELARIREDRIWEIVDVTFGKCDDEEKEYLTKMDEIDREKRTVMRQL